MTDISTTLGEPFLPTTIEELVIRLQQLQAIRRKLHLDERAPRRGVRGKTRETVLKKTNGRCHICGGQVGDDWEADHVLACTSKGEHLAHNLLPAHGLCNGYRWDYLSEEFQWILKMGVWARTLMAHHATRRSSKLKQLGRNMVEEFFRYEEKRVGRHKTKPQPST